MCTGQFLCEPYSVWCCLHSYDFSSCCECVNPSLLRLVDTLDAHLENNNLEGPPQLGELPDDITLAETVATWKYVVHFQEKQKRD